MALSGLDAPPPRLEAVTRRARLIRTRRIGAGILAAGIVAAGIALPAGLVSGIRGERPDRLSASAWPSEGSEEHVDRDDGYVVTLPRGWTFREDPSSPGDQDRFLFSAGSWAFQRSGPCPVTAEIPAGEMLVWVRDLTPSTGGFHPFTRLEELPHPLSLRDLYFGRDRCSGSAYTRAFRLGRRALVLWVALGQPLRQRSQLDAALSTVAIRRIPTGEIPGFVARGEGFGEEWILRATPGPSPTEVCSGLEGFGPLGCNAGIRGLPGGRMALVVNTVRAGERAYYLWGPVDPRAHTVELIYPKGPPNVTRVLDGGDLPVDFFVVPTSRPDPRRVIARAADGRVLGRAALD